MTLICPFPAIDDLLKCSECYRKLHRAARLARWPSTKEPTREFDRARGRPARLFALEGAVAAFPLRARSAPVVPGGLPERGPALRHHPLALLARDVVDARLLLDLVPDLVDLRLDELRALVVL